MARNYFNTTGAIASQVNGIEFASLITGSVFDDSTAMTGATTTQGAIEVNDSRLDEIRDRDYVTDFQTGLI